jgi:hypothetical protein
MQQSEFAWQPFPQLDPEYAVIKGLLDRGIMAQCLRQGRLPKTTLPMESDDAGCGLTSARLQKRLFQFLKDLAFYIVFGQSRHAQDARTLWTELRERPQQAITDILVCLITVFPVLHGPLVVGQRAVISALSLFPLASSHHDRHNGNPSLLLLFQGSVPTLLTPLVIKEIITQQQNDKVGLPGVPVYSLPDIFTWIDTSQVKTTDGAVAFQPVVI